MSNHIRETRKWNSCEDKYIYDSETCHIIEDEIWRDVLNAIADGVDNPRNLAKKALSTTRFNFERWYG